MHVDPRSIHAYVIGEHGDSEFIPWSNAMLSTRAITDFFDDPGFNLGLEDLDTIEEEVRSAAYKIIEAKRATYYGIGMALTRITKAILGDESSVLTVSAHLKGEYGEQGLYAGVPCIINKNGIQKILELDLTDKEKAKFAESCRILRENLAELGDAI